MSQLHANEVNEAEVNEAEGMETSTPATITTSAMRKTIAEGIKPQGWQIQLPNPYAGMNLEQLCDAIGEDRVLSFASQKLVIAFQSAVRLLADKGVSDEEIAEKMKDWKPGTRTSGGTGDLLKNFSSMSREQQEALMQKLNAMLN